MPEPSYLPALGELARLHGIQTAYRDVFGRRRPASQAALLAALAALGAPVEGLEDVDAALAARRRRIAQRLAVPVAVSWGSRSARVDLHVPAGREDEKVRCRLSVEGGDVREWTVPAGDCPAAGAVEADGVRRSVRRLAVPARLPFGYQRLETALGDEVAETLVVCAPGAAPGMSRDRGTGEGAGARPTARRGWGGFMPIYALRSERDWGIGDLTDLSALLDWLRSAGGDLAATLPFFADFYDEPFDPSPYAPATRLFWNEIVLDVSRVPELAACPEARELVASPGFRTEVEQLRASAEVDYLQVMALKRGVLEQLAGALDGQRRREFEAFVAADPLLDDYARFRSACERLGRPWTTWSEGPRQGALPDAAVDEARSHFHRYVQWLLHEQLDSLAEGGGGPLYLDLPIGVNPAGFDVWHEPQCFVAGTSAGAPPDSVFTKGQDWGFPPMHPDGLRDTGYRYLAETFRRMLRYAGVLRVDHVMGLHRLFVIPPGLEASQGVYLRYPAEELYAVLVLEAHRAEAVVLGEDLGTVPGYVRTSMDRRNVHHSYVVQYELAGGDRLRPARAADVASLNTHDMPTFAAFWRGADIDDRLDLGLIDEDAAADERVQRDEIRHRLVGLLRREGMLGLGDAPGPEEVLRACLGYLAAGDAALVVVNLEDLWLEEEPHNVPGTTAERPNWRRKARFTVEGMRASAPVVAILEEIDRLRRKDEE